jgi:hypothetical protein
MKQPIMFRKLLDYWTTAPRLIDAGIKDGHVAREPRKNWVPLKGLSPISDLMPPQAFANPGWAGVHYKFVMKFRRLEAFSAFWSGMSKAELEARLATYAVLMTALARHQGTEDTALPPSHTAKVD